MTIAERRVAVMRRLVTVDLATLERIEAVLAFEAPPAEPPRWVPPAEVAARLRTLREVRDADQVVVRREGTRWSAEWEALLQSPTWAAVERARAEGGEPLPSPPTLVPLQEAPRASAAPPTAPPRVTKAPPKVTR